MYFLLANLVQMQIPEWVEKLVLFPCAGNGTQGSSSLAPWSAHSFLEALRLCRVSWAEEEWVVCVQHQEVASSCAFEVVGQHNVSGQFSCQELTRHWQRRNGLVVQRTECRGRMTEWTCKGWRVGTLTTMSQVLVFWKECSLLGVGSCKPQGRSDWSWWFLVRNREQLWKWPLYINRWGQRIVMRLQ